MKRSRYPSSIIHHPSSSVRRPFFIGLAGGSGSGKSTLATALRRALGPTQCRIISQDSYYLGNVGQRCSQSDNRSCCSVFQPAPHNFDHPKAIDWPRFVSDLLALKQFQPIQLPRYCFKRHQRIGFRALRPTNIIIVEGILILQQPAIARLIDLKIFIHIDDDLRLLRRLRRDVRHRGRSLESVLKQYEATVRPMHRQYVQPCRARADLVLEEEPLENWLRKTLAAVKKGYNVAWLHELTG